MIPKSCFRLLCRYCPVLLCVSLAARAEVRLHGLFSDNLVLQQNTRAPVWGWADEGEKVTVSFRGKKVSTTAKGGKSS